MEQESITSCKGKNSFSSAKIEKDVARRSRRCHDCERIIAYKCQHCGQWHTGTSSKPRGHRREKHD